MKRSQLLLGTALAGTVLFAAAPADAQFYARLDSGYAWGQDAGFGDNQLAGIYRETITGLHKDELHIQGVFRLHHASRIGVLNDGMQ